RFWGLALPIWVCTGCGHFDVIGSRQELKERAVEGWDRFEGHSPHRPWIDLVKIKCSQCGGTASRIPDVGNPWLDAGIVPFSTLEYNSDKDYWRRWFPANFITESFPGQFRNWFYALLVMACALENAAPYQTVLGFATLLDERGDEMHKSRGNSIPFDAAADVVGADTMRWLYANQPPEQDLRFPRIPSEEDAAAARAAGQPPRLSDLWLQSRNTLDKLWDVYRFFVTYANIDGFDPTSHTLPVAERGDADRWALSELHTLIATVERHLAAYDARAACAAITEFVLNLSNWYVRRSRRQFWKGEEDAGKVGAYLTLYECLVTVTKLLAPITPFLAEALYQNLVRRVDQRAPLSVHLADWPRADAALVDRRLHDETALVLRLVNLGRSAREKAQLRVRQPLARLYVRVTTAAERESLSRLQGQVLEELNVKQLDLLPAESDMLAYTLRPRPQALGPKYGKLLPQVLAATKALDAYEGAAALRDHGQVTVEVAGQALALTADEVEVVASARDGYVAAEDHGYVVALETALTPELLAEGLVRDLTHHLQDVRKRAGLEIEDAIDAWLTTDAALAEIVRREAAYVADETLARHLAVMVAGLGDLAEERPPAGAYTETIPAAKLGGHEVAVVVARVAKGAK
ncbi:MAG TPA: DUF5915 domain-containing protein, partial [Ktedonobacterales bacterium]|nr:DUF5915 domain-containing protein [Ktedonobacterales bacterium]